MLKYIHYKIVDILQKKTFRNRCPVVFDTKDVLKIFSKFTGKQLCGALSCRPETCNFIKKETLTQVFFGKFCEIFKITFFIEHLWWSLLNYFICMSLL